MDMKQKITKLLEKANSTTHEAEAEVLMAKARALMEEHQISMYELGEDPFQAKQSTSFQKGTQAQIRYDLQSSLAEYLGMKVAVFTFNRRPDERLPRAVFEFVGTKSAHITLDYLFPFVWNQILRLVNETTEAGVTALERTLRGGLGSDRERVWKQAQRKLLKDTAVAMQIRLDELRDAKAGRPAEGSATANALVKIGGELDAFFDDRFPNLAEGKNRIVNPIDAARKLAARVRLETQVDAQEDPTRLLK